MHREVFKFIVVTVDAGSGGCRSVRSPAEVRGERAFRVIAALLGLSVAVDLGVLGPGVIGGAVRVHGIVH